MSFPGQAALVYAVALALAVAVALAHPLLGEPVLLVTMFTPLAAVLILRLAILRDGWRLAAWADIGLHRAGLRLWPLAVLLPALALLPGYLIAWTMLGATVSPPPLSDLPRETVRLAITILVGALLGALGEEVCWRGYMLPRLMPRLGDMRAMWLTGFLQGVWHLPLILLTPYYHSGGSVWIVVPLFLAVLTLAGGFFGYLRAASLSIWPVAIAHRSLNTFWERLDGATASDRPWLLEYVAGEAGVAIFLVLVFVNLMLFGIRRRPTVA